MSLKEKKKEIFPDAGKPQSRYEDNRYGGGTVNKARQQQKREHVLNQMIRGGETKKNMGMVVSPEEEWVMNNRHLFL